MTNTPPPQIYRDIEAAMQRGDVPSAIGLARAALDSGLSHPLLFNLRAHWHEGGGRLGEACADLERALALAPNDPRLLEALGRCLSAASRHRAAANVYERAAAAGPDRAGAHYGLGFAREQLGELGGAWTAYGRAFELDPQADEPVARMAGLAARRGAPAEARALAETALALNPKSVTAAFAHIVSDLAEKKFAEAEARARAVGADPQVVPQARATALNFAGDAADGQGHAPEAFDFYRRANEGLRTLFRATFEGQETGRKLAMRLAKDFAATPSQAWQPPPGASSDEAPVFLLGFPRSGTTLLGQVLASHPNVATVEEKPLLREAVRDFAGRPDGLARLAALSPGERQHYRDAFRRALGGFGIETRGRLVVDQSPFNTLYLPVIAALFPQAKVIFALRDPRDVVLSCFRRLFAMSPYVYEFLSLEGTARFYDETMRLAALYRSRLALSLVEVRNEDLVADFDGQTRALCGFLGLEWDDAMREFARAARARRVATASAMQVAQGIDASLAGHWRAYADELAPVMPIVAPWVERFGYA